MIKVITYGTFDLLHEGHIRLLKRAKQLGSYLIVGVTSDDFDKARGKINVQQSLYERVEAVKTLGIADEIIIEEYEGQKIDDICKLNIDIFTVGSDWIGKFDYLKRYCDVVYLERTEGISSSDIRAKKHTLNLGFVGDTYVLEKYLNESSFVNGVNVAGIYAENTEKLSDILKSIPFVAKNYDELLNQVDAVLIYSNPQDRAKYAKVALSKGKHVLCASPVALTESTSKELFDLAKSNNCTIMEAIKTAYFTAYSRLLLLIKSGVIGEIVSVDTTCTSLKKTAISFMNIQNEEWGSLKTWGPIAVLPIFQILGTEYKDKRIVTKLAKDNGVDEFTKIDFIYPNAVASLKVGTGAKAEGDLVISGTKGYIYVPAPWWKTDYFEVRYEDFTNNKRYFYHLDGEGLRYEIAAFTKTIESIKLNFYIDTSITYGISRLMNDFDNRTDTFLLN